MEQQWIDNGIEKAKDHDYMGAITAFSEAIKVNPISARAYSQRGLTYYDMGLMDEANSDHTQALELQPKDFTASYGRSLTRLALKNYSGALSDIEVALGVKPQHPGAQQLRGHICRQLNQISEAIASFKIAAELYLGRQDKDSCQACINSIRELQLDSQVEQDNLHSDLSDGGETDQETDSSQDMSHHAEGSQDEQDVANVIAQKIVESFAQASKRRFTFLLVGRTGVGKSSTINNLMGQEVAKVGDNEATTSDVTIYDETAYGVPFRVIDTPGLCDDLPEAGNDEEYLYKIQHEIQNTNLDCMWFVTNLNETRVRGDEKRAIKLINQAFGEEIWNHAIIVFTFADKFNPDKFDDKFTKRTNSIREEIASYVGQKIAKKVPSVPVNNENKKTPDGKYWLGELYTSVFSRMGDQAMQSFYMATAKRLKVEDKETGNNDNNECSDDDSFSEEADIQLTSEQGNFIGSKIIDYIKTALDVVDAVGTITDAVQIIVNVAEADSPVFEKVGSCMEKVFSIFSK